ncbi:GLUG motif-containing protein, partial [Klebsiella pneumoniae]|uniref:GLUG motif-containing protein n=1 Tax=Klebsiella pneumoniae TaxID=573 RepID=UPI003EE0EA01
ATGNITATGGGNYLGGLIGTLDSGSTLTGSYAKGTVSTGSSSSQVGGLIGTAYGVALNSLSASGAVTVGAS